jgi:hypothetical protein
VVLPLKMTKRLARWRAIFFLESIDKADDDIEIKRIVDKERLLYEELRGAFFSDLSSQFEGDLLINNPLSDSENVIKI